MNITIIFGAGASLAHAQHFRPSQVRTHPPLDYTFFEKIRQLENIHVPDSLERYAERLPSGNPFKAGVENRMEEFFRDAFYDYLEAGSSKGITGKAYLQLVDVYRDVIRATTNWMVPSSYTGGPIGRIISGAADIADNLDIITFNHDLVIENEIVKRARLRPRWCLEYGYGSFSDNRKMLSSKWPKLFPVHSSTCNHSRPIQIHKLHGSLNWMVRIRGREPTHSMLTGQASGYDVLVSRRREVPRSFRVTTTKAGGRRSSGYTWPVIVPPVYAKQPLIRTFMPSVWSDARAALRSADRILFCGYSMPQIDVEAEKLFERAISLNQELPWIGVIDPSANAVYRYAEVLRESSIRRFTSVESFLAQSDPWR